MAGSRTPPNAGKGRPKGSKNKATADVRALARTYTLEAIDTLVRLMRGQHTRGELPVLPQTRLCAAQELLNRGYGKAPQAMTGEDGTGPVHITMINELHPNG